MIFLVFTGEPMCGLEEIYKRGCSFTAGFALAGEEGDGLVP